MFLPATMSKTILTDILRGDLGFEGVMVTDALDMAAITDNFSIEDTIRLTINAGADLLILPAVKDTNLFSLTDTYADTAAALVENGEISEARIDESVLRILRLKQKYGILDLKDYSVTDERIAKAKGGIGSAAHRETEWQIAEKALTLWKNEGNAFPLHVQRGEKTLILFADSCASRAGAGDLVRQMLEKKQELPEGAEILVMKNTRENEEECIQAATDAVLLTYWGSAMQKLTAENASWSPNLPAGLLACFGACAAEGTSPVKLPAPDDQYAGGTERGKR